MLATVSHTDAHGATVQQDIVRKVKVVTVSSGGEPAGRNLPGSVRASKRVDLAFQIHGRLIDLPVQEGQFVQEGEILAKLDPRDLEIAVRNTESQVQRAQAVVRLSTIEYERLERVKNAEPGAVAQSQIDRAVEHQAMAHADLLAAESARDFAQLQLSYTCLKAPFSGVVSSRGVDNFQEVLAKQPIVTLDDLSLVEVVVDIPESLMAPVMRPGSHLAYAEFASAPGKKYPLNLKEYATRANPSTLTYQVVGEMKQPEDGTKVLPGMTANVWAEPTEAEALSIKVPVVAVFTSLGKSPHVWVVDPKDMTVHAREVETGDLAGIDSVEILEGLQAGETIAVSAVTELRDGMKIQRFE
jgi:RND family efflux transporter MFP subunit